MRCMTCFTLVSKRADRMAGHLNTSCKAKSASSKRSRHDEAGPQQDAATDDEVTILDSPSTSGSSQVGSAPHQQPKLTPWVVKTDASTRDKLDRTVAEFFYGCNVPFSVADHPLFIQMVDRLRPGYRSPDRKKLAGPLLDSVHQDMKKAMKAKLQDVESVTLVQDGWSNIHNEPVVAHTICTPGNSFFLNAVATEAMEKSAANCAVLAEDAMALAKQEYDVEVTGICTDNAAAMNRMRDILKESQPNLETWGCSSHLLNLLGQDVTPDNVIGHVVKVQKHFRNHHREGALLKAEPNTVKPELPCATRWSSQIGCIGSYLKNRAAYIKVCEDLERPDEAIRRIVNDYALYRSAKDLMEQLQPIRVALDRLQSDSATIADAAEAWMMLANDGSLEPHASAVARRCRQALRPVHAAANLLDPRYFGRRLTEELRQSAEEWLGEDLFADVVLLESQQSPYPAAFFRPDFIAKLTPKAWWLGMKRRPGVSQELCDKALTILSMPPSSASIERTFSNFSAVQTKLRNRLGQKTSEKLVFCYRMLRGKHDTSDW